MLIACGAALEFQNTAEAFALPAGAILIALIPFALFLAFVAGKNPFVVIKLKCMTAPSEAGSLSKTPSPAPPPSCSPAFALRCL